MLPLVLFWVLVLADAVAYAAGLGMLVSSMLLLEGAPLVITVAVGGSGILALALAMDATHSLLETYDVLKREGVAP